jgi:2-oxoglutarate dehydrogenase E2 component (dihydrolipoamide succinyltransferase)
MLIEVTLPRLGETVEDATITRWLKAVGDQVEAGEPIVEVGTDKVDTEVEATASGRIASLLVNVNDVVPVGTPIATIDDSAG